MNISYIIPVFNNAATLSKLSKMLADLSLAMKWNYEVIFVDDCSIDNSLEILSTLNTNCGIIHLKKNQGQSTTVLVGMNYANGDVMVVMDADLQDRPDFIPSLIKKLNHETEVVFSGRRGLYEKKVKILSAKAFKYLLHLLSIKRLPIDACMFFSIKRNAVLKLLPYIGSKPYLLSVIAKSNLKCESIPYFREPNIYGKSNYNFLKRWRIAYKAISNFIFLQPKNIDATLIQIIKMPPEF